MTALQENYILKWGDPAICMIHVHMYIGLYYQMDLDFYLQYRKKYI